VGCGVVWWGENMGQKREREGEKMRERESLDYEDGALIEKKEKNEVRPRGTLSQEPQQALYLIGEPSISCWTFRYSADFVWSMFNQFKVKEMKRIKPVPHLPHDRPSCVPPGTRGPSEKKQMNGFYHYVRNSH